MQQYTSKRVVAVVIFSVVFGELFVSYFPWFVVVIINIVVVVIVVS